MCLRCVLFADQGWASPQIEGNSEQKYKVNSMGVNSVSWAPFDSLGSQPNVARLVTGSCDNKVKMFR
jgi:hypothetical protein